MAGMIPNQWGSLGCYNYFGIMQQRMPPSPPPPPPEVTITLPTGQLVTVPVDFGPRWCHAWEQHASHWNYINLWYHTLVIHYRQGSASPFWKEIDSRLGFLGLIDQSFANAFDISNHWTLEEPLNSGLRCLESLDLGTQSLCLGDLDKYSTDNNMRPFGYGRRNMLRPFLLKMPTAYKTFFEIKQGEDLVKVKLAPLSPASQYHLDTLLRYDEVYVLKHSDDFY